MIVLIGARSGSKRIPNKNIRLLGNLPLIAYSILIGKQLKLKTYVSSDSKKILDISKLYGAIPIERPEELATDTSTDYDWIIHAINNINLEKENEKEKNEEILFLRPTSPLRDILEIKRAILEFDRKKSTSLRSVEPLKEAIQKSFIIWKSDSSGKDYLIPSVAGIDLIDTNNPNQDFPVSYSCNGIVDILKTDYILDSSNKKDIYGSKIQAFITDRTVEIDDECDFRHAEFIVDNYDKYKL